MSDENKFEFVRLGETREQAEERVYGKVRTTRGTPIEKLPRNPLLMNTSIPIDKLNEVIDRINSMNEL